MLLFCCGSVETREGAPTPLVLELQAFDWDVDAHDLIGAGTVDLGFAVGEVRLASMYRGKAPYLPLGCCVHACMRMCTRVFVRACVCLQVCSCVCR